MSGSMIGRTFSGRYRIVERIGIGGMAEVYRAQDTVLGRIVAVKVMLPAASDSPVATVVEPSLTVNLKPERSMLSG